MKKEMHIEMPDGSIWAVDVESIARNRAFYYRSEFEGDEERSYQEDTKPLFDEDDYEIQDWASNNMNWSDVAHIARKVKTAEMDYQEGWTNGNKTFAMKES